MYAYLINTRKISPEIVTSLVKNHSLYQDKNGIAVFLHKDENGNPIGAQMHGTLSEKKFKKNIGIGEFVFDKGTPDTAYLFESTIDMMSFMQMHPEINNAKFVSMAGLKPSIAMKMAEQGLAIVSCVDNDVEAEKFNARLQVNGIELTSKLSSLKVEKEPQQFEDVNYFKGKINDNNCFFFASSEDCKKVCSNIKLDGKIFQTSHADNCFMINKDCVKAGVKDFNELLVKNTALQVKKNTPSLSSMRKTAKEQFTQQQDDSNLTRDGINNGSAKLER